MLLMLSTIVCLMHEIRVARGNGEIIDCRWRCGYKRRVGGHTKTVNGRSHGHNRPHLKNVGNVGVGVGSPEDHPVAGLDSSTVTR